MKYSSLILLFALSSCATTTDSSPPLDSWIGTKADLLVDRWGPPSKTFTMNNGKKVFTYLSDGGAEAYSYKGYTSISNRECKVDFYIDGSDAVSSWRWDGNDCSPEDKWWKNGRPPIKTTFCRLGLEKCP